VESMNIPASVSIPIMAWRRFADCVGMDQEIIRGMCEKGHLPVVRIGKHRFVNLVLLSQKCLQSED
jgi:hypothetical protein